MRRMVTHAVAFALVGCGWCEWAKGQTAEPYARISDERIVSYHDAGALTPAFPPAGSGEFNGGIAGTGGNVCAVAARAWHGQPAPGGGGGTLSPVAFAHPAQLDGRNAIVFFAQVNGSPRNQGIFVARASGISAIV